MLSPAARLKAALRGPVADVLALAARAGVSEMAGRRAHRGRPSSVDNYLKLSAVVGIDPVNGDPAPVTTLGDFHPISLGCAVRMLRYQRDQSQKDFARATGLTAPTLFRIEQGDPVSIENTIAICAFLGRHPHDFISPNVSRRTVGEVTAHERTREMAS